MHYNISSKILVLFMSRKKRKCQTVMKCPNMKKMNSANSVVANTTRTKTTTRRIQKTNVWTRTSHPGDVCAVSEEQIPVMWGIKTVSLVHKMFAMSVWALASVALRKWCVNFEMNWFRANWPAKMKYKNMHVICDVWDMVCDVICDDLQMTYNVIWDVITSGRHT